MNVLTGTALVGGGSYLASRDNSSSEQPSDYVGYGVDPSGYVSIPPYLPEQPSQQEPYNPPVEQRSPYEQSQPAQKVPSQNLAEPKEMPRSRAWSDKTTNQISEAIGVPLTTAERVALGRDIFSPDDPYRGTAQQNELLIKVLKNRINNVTNRPVTEGLYKSRVF